VSNLWTFRESASVNGNDIIGYDVEAVDGSIGKIDDLTNQTDSAHVVVDTGWWIFGKKRLIPAGVITLIDHDAGTVSVQLTKDQIKSAPDYDETVVFSATDRNPYDEYYRPFGW
jgi:hypothetical protein